MTLTLVSYRLHLYSRRAFQASAVLLLAATAFVTAAAQHRNSHKLRATGVLELGTDSTGTHFIRLTAVTIVDNGRLRDASIAESKPQPMALENGVVYEAQKNGMPVGTLTITNSRESNGIWVAGGRWQLADKPKPKAAPSATPAAGSGDERPRIHRSDNAGSASSPAPSSASTLPAPPATPVPAPAPLDPPEPDRNRPTLRHQATTGQQQPEIENQMLLAQRTGSQTLVAGSDAQFSDSRSYEFPWKPEEKPQVEAKMRKLALAQLPSEKPALTESALRNVTIRSFDLDQSNDAVVVLTAEVAPAPVVPAPKGARGAKGAGAPVPAKPVGRFITLIARFDFDGNPAKLLANVTDASRLDVVPRLELIDAVDVDGDSV